MDIRNFVIIAHIDHGKSTLADRFLEITGTVEPRQMKNQYLDQLELERERGITIKMAPVRMLYHPDRGLTQNNTQTNAEAENEFLYGDITYKIRGAVFAIKKNLGLGHKENIYQKSLIEELIKIGLKFEVEKNIDIFYQDKKVGVYRPDLIVEDKIIIELKSLPFLGKIEEKQLWHYLKGSPYKLALLINFGNKDVEIKRIVYDTARFPREFLRESASSQRESAQVEYILNLIDTPGHPDFSYEVSRALAAVEGAILLVDATKGIQAQTLANFRLAQKSNLKIIGAVNKVDMNSPQLENVIKETATLLNCDQSEILKVSGKTGEGVSNLLEAVVKNIPPPKFLRESALARPSFSVEKFGRVNPHSSALVFDSFYDNHKGIIASVRLFNGELKTGDEIYFAVTHQKAKVKELGYFAPALKKTEKLSAGEIGYIVSGIKEPERVKIGDTILAANFQFSISNFQKLALSGYKEPTPVVFTSFYPEDANEYENFKKALAKLRLNDSSLKFEGDFNEVLGRGVKIGFLGKLHFEITSERLAREFNIKTVNTYPSIIYKIKSSNSTYVEIKNPEDFPEDAKEALEQMVKLEIITPPAYFGNVLQLKNIFHLAHIETHTLGENTLITAAMPLRELIADFDDRLKSVSAGFASFSYELTDWQQADLRKMQILIAGESTQGLTRIVSKEEGEREARRTVGKLKELLPRQQFSQAIQAKIEGRIVARETVPALRKDVTGYLYGGDRTRKMKLWKKQKAGKKKLLARARVNIPMQVFKDLIK